MKPTLLTQRNPRGPRALLDLWYAENDIEVDRCVAEVERLLRDTYQGKTVHIPHKTCGSTPRVRLVVVRLFQDAGWRVRSSRMFDPPDVDPARLRNVISSYAFSDPNHADLAT